MMFLRILTAVLLVSSLWACSSKPMPEALESLKLAQETDDYYLFEAENPITDTCYIYYPGGLVHAEAYAPYTAAVAKQGAHSFLLKLTLDMAMMDVDAANDAKQSEFAKANCKNYVLGGHSLGGIGIAMYGENNKDDGLLFISSYAHKEDLVDQHPQPVMVVYGENDLLSTEAEIMEAKGNLPDTAQYFKIDGGNHAQMGFYGPQNNDGEPTITREEQQRVLVEKTMEIIQQMSTQ
jgi:hypothetical protein